MGKVLSLKGYAKQTRRYDCLYRQPHGTPARGEVDGVDYHFLTQEQFTEKIEQGAFLEWAKYGDNTYGTLKSEITASRQEGKDTVLEIEVNGATPSQGARPISCKKYTDISNSRFVFTFEETSP